MAIRARLASLALAFALAALGHPAAAAPPADPSLVGTTASLELHSSFWINLHHTLYAAAWDRRPEATGRARKAGKSVPFQAPLAPAEQRAWSAAVDGYARALASRDLLFDRGMTALKVALGRSGAALVPDPAIPAAVRDALVAAAPVYRAHGWPADDRANRAWIAAARRRLETLAPEVTPRLASLLGTPWPSSPVRVDAVRVANRQGAYTSIGPAWIVVSTSDPDNQGWAAVEILLHESSHLLIRPVRSALADAGRELHRTVPRDLWHVVLFYTAGELTRQALAGRGVTYVPYLYRTGLFDRAWPAYRPAIEATLPGFVAGKVPLAATARALVAALGTADAAPLGEAPGSPVPGSLDHR